jgi:hypothetical protein
MEAEPAPSLELALQPLQKLAVAVEPGDLVFVLVGQELEIIAGDDDLNAENTRMATERALMEAKSQ